MLQILRDRVLNDSSFAGRVVSFLESTVIENVELMTTEIPRIPDRPQHFSTEDEVDDSFRKRLDADSNAVAAKVQIHSKHSATWT